MFERSPRGLADERDERRDVRRFGPTWGVCTTEFSLPDIVLHKILSGYVRLQMSFSGGRLRLLRWSPCGNGGQNRSPGDGPHKLCSPCRRKQQRSNSPTVTKTRKPEIWIILG